MHRWFYLLLFVFAEAQNFSIPRLPISKAGAKYPQCKAEVIFVLDVSASMALSDQRAMMRFVTQFMVALEQNLNTVRFGVVIFGIKGGAILSKGFDGRDFGVPPRSFMGPFGNNNTIASSEVLLRLAPLQYGCAECVEVNSSWSQLEMMYTVNFTGFLTPTWDGLNMATHEFDIRGDATIKGRYIILITDGVPNDNNCQPATLDGPACAGPLANTSAAILSAKHGALVATIGMNLQNNTQALMVQWASEPKDIFAVPSIDYSGLVSLIPKLSAILCPGVPPATACLALGVTKLTVSGTGFLNTNTLACRFIRQNEPPAPERTTTATYINSTTLECPLPLLAASEWSLEYTIDGRAYYSGSKFRTDCDPNGVAPLLLWAPSLVLGFLISY